MFQLEAPHYQHFMHANTSLLREVGEVIKKISTIRNLWKVFLGQRTFKIGFRNVQEFHLNSLFI